MTTPLGNVNRYDDRENGNLLLESTRVTDMLGNTSSASEHRCLVMGYTYQTGSPWIPVVSSIGSRWLQKSEHGKCRTPLTYDEKKDGHLTRTMSDVIEILRVWTHGMFSLPSKCIPLLFEKCRHDPKLRLWNLQTPCTLTKGQAQIKRSRLPVLLHWCDTWYHLRNLNCMKTIVKRTWLRYLQ